MTREGIKKTLALLKLAYANYYKDATLEEMQALIKLWEIQFDGYDDKLIAYATNCLVSTNKYPPTIADIKEMIVKLNSDAQLSVHDAWNKVMDCIKDCHNKSKYDSLDENIKAVLTRGEIIEAGMGDVDGIPFIKNRFVNDYTSQLEKTNERLKIESCKPLGIENEKDRIRLSQ